MKVIKDSTPEVKKTFVTFVLDDSGSMKSVAAETRNAFNNQLETIKKMENAEHEVYVTFIKFSDPNNIVTLRSNIRASEVKPLTIEDYDANGGYTALLDAMMQGIAATETRNHEIDQPGNAALVCFFTDGGENASLKYSNRKDLVKEKIETLTGKGNWTFTFMGTESLESVQSGYGISASNATMFQAGVAGMHVNSTRTMGGLEAYGDLRLRGVTSSVNFYDGTVDKEEEKLNPNT